MEFKRKASKATPSVKLMPSILPVSPVVPTVQRQVTLRRQLQQHTVRPVQVQRQVVQPVMQAAHLHVQEVQRLATQRETLQRKMAHLSVPSTEVMQRVVRSQEPEASPVPLKPQSVGDWVAVMCRQAEQAQGRRMNSHEFMQYTALQRHVAQTLSQAFRQDKNPAVQRYEEFGQHLANLQRVPGALQVAQATLHLIPSGERPALQHVMDEVLQHRATQAAQETEALKAQDLQQQLSDLERQSQLPVHERVLGRRGSGNPLPEAVARYLQQDMNTTVQSPPSLGDIDKARLPAGLTDLPVNHRSGLDLLPLDSLPELPSITAGDAGEQHADQVAAEVSQTSPIGHFDGVRRATEQITGSSLADVQIHQNSTRAQRLGAQAFTRGNTIHFAPGTFDPGTRRGQRLIAHELAHVTQRRPVTQFKFTAKKLEEYLTRSKTQRKAILDELQRMQKDLALDLVQAGVNVAGLAPGPVGMVADVADAAISAARGDWIGAGLSLFSAIPVLGDAVGNTAKAAKLTKKIAATRKRIGMLSRRLDQVNKHLHFLQVEYRKLSKAVPNPMVKKVNGRWPINKEFAGRVFPVHLMPKELRAKYPRSVRFTKGGFPDFTPYVTKKYTFKNGFVDGDKMDFAEANKALGLKARDLMGFTWHHSHDGKSLLLVPRDLHEFVRHTGGAALRGQP